MTLLRPSLLLLLCLLAQPAAGQGTARPSADLDALRAALEHWVSSRHPWQSDEFSVDISADRLDSRTRLAACRQSVTFTLPPGQRYRARTSILVTCPDSAGGWRLLWPVSIRASTEVLIARSALPAGSVLGEQQTMRQSRDIASLPQGIIRPDQADGLQTRMTIAAGSIITQAQTRPVPLVHKGQHVTLRVQMAGIGITMAGEALEDAGLGERVRVRNPNSGKALEGTVTAAGEVNIQP